MVGGLSLHPRYQHLKPMEESKAKESRVDQSLSKQIEILVASVEELRDIIFNSSSKNKVYNEHIRSLEVPGPLMPTDILESFLRTPAQAVARSEPEKQAKVSKVEAMEVEKTIEKTVVDRDEKEIQKKEHNGPIYEITSQKKVVTLKAIADALAKGAKFKYDGEELEDDPAEILRIFQEHFQLVKEWEEKELQKVEEERKKKEEEEKKIKEQEEKEVKEAKKKEEEEAQKKKKAVEEEMKKVEESQKSKRQKLMDLEEKWVYETKEWDVEERCTGCKKQIKNHHPRFCNGKYKRFHLECGICPGCKYKGLKNGQFDMDNYQVECPECGYWVELFF